MATSVSSSSHRLNSSGLSYPILTTSPTDLKLILETFSDPSATREDLSNAYGHLAVLLISSPSSKEASRKDENVRAIARITGDWLSDTHLVELAKAFAALSAVLQVDTDAFTKLMQTDALGEKLMDAAETLTSDFKIASDDEMTLAQRHLASFISNAAGYSATRSLARSVAMLGNQQLRRRFEDQHEDLETRIAAAVALIKLQMPDESAGAAKDVPSLTIPANSELLGYLVMLFTSTGLSRSARSLILEGLAILTLRPSMRRIFVQDTTRIEFLIQTVKADAAGEFYFSIASILSHLSSYHRQRGGEAPIQERLRDFANTKARQNDADEKEEADSEVNERIDCLIQAGVMQGVVAFVKSPSPAVRQLAAVILLALIDKKERRGRIIQQGGAKALLAIIKQAKVLSSSEAGPCLAEDLTAIQALSRLLITANPLLVLGPTSSSPALVDAIKPLSLPITMQSSTLLQQFESLMALTNIASISERLQDKISGVDGLLQQLEEIMLEGSSQVAGDAAGTDGRALCRRAATELVCNLVPSEAAFLRYTALDQAENLDHGKLPAAVASRLHLLVALSDAEDCHTRRAALGVLASLTLAPTCCNFLAVNVTRFRVLLDAVQDGDAAIQLRGMECLKNIAISQASTRGEVKALLKKLDENSNENIRIAASDALKAIANL